MMGNSKSYQSEEKNPLESRSPEKQSRATSQKTSEKKNANKHNRDQHKKQHSSTHANSVSSNNGSASTSSGAPLARRPLRSAPSAEPDDAVGAKSTRVPLVVPKVEETVFHRKTFHISRDPRMTANPILDHGDDSVGDTCHGTFHQLLRDDTAAATEPGLDFIVDVNVEDVKSEVDKLGLADDSDWKSRFLNGAKAIRQVVDKNTDNCGPSIRVKTEPIEQDGLEPTFEPIEDDHCSIDSGSTVGLPSPGRGSPTPSCPSPRPTEDPAKLGQDDRQLLGSSPNGMLSQLENGRLLANSESEEVSRLVTKNSDTADSYSPATDLEEEYRKLERDKIAAAMLAQREYSRENSESSSDEEMALLTERHSQEAAAFHATDFGDDDDGEQFGDFDQDTDPSWASPVPPHEGGKTGEKRPLATEVVDDVHEATDLPAKRSKFQVLKFPQDGGESIVQPLAVDGMDTSTSACTVPSSATNSINVETPTPNQPLETESGGSSSQSAPSSDKNASSSRPRIPVKLTTVNRASMMVEDYLNSANINAASVRNKRAVTPSKSTAKRQKRVDSESRTPPRSVSVEFEDGIAGAAGVRQDDAPPQFVVALRSNARDPRRRRRDEETCSTAESSAPCDAMSQFNGALRNRILMRVLKLWQFKWLEQQLHNKQPPPLLDQDKNFPLEIPQLGCVPVLTKYGDLHSYYDIFHPLLLHEMWSSLVVAHHLQNRERTSAPWKCLVESSTQEDAFVLVRCSTVLEHEKEAPVVDDLVVMTFNRATGKLLHPFGFVESCETSRLFKLADVDETLMPQDRSKANYWAQVVIRITKSYAPKKCAAGQKGIICAVERIASLTPFMDLFHAQAAFKFSPLRDIILHPRPFAFQLMHSQRLFQMDYLNPLQMEAYLSIGQTMLITPSDQPKIAMLEGFPGTGKTHVIVHIINHLLGHKLGNMRPKILYCAPTHAAVDEMTRRLVKLNKLMESRFDVLRMGTWARLHPDIREATLEDKLTRLRARIKQENPARNDIRSLEEKCFLLHNLKQSILKELNQDSHSMERIGELKDKLAELNDEIETATVFLASTKTIQEDKVEKDLQHRKRLTIQQADVICTTLETCSSADLRNIFIDRKRDNSEEMPRPFLCCIIDDASLCTEPQTLIPLALGIKKLILVGDVELVPFTLSSSVAKESRLDQSLFSRFHSYLNLEHDQRERMIFSLNTQHRMHPEICQWTSKYYYGNRLLTCATLSFNTPLHAYRILDVKDSVETADGSSFVNRPEAEVIVKIVECLIGSPHLKERTIGIVTFYEKQRILIRHLIRERMPKDYVRTDVRLVQDVQGSETDIVIISCVKTKIRASDKNLATLIEHWNVALTRATESLFICASLKTLQASEVLKDLIYDADKRQVIQRVSSLFDRSMLYDVLLKPNDYMAM